MLIGRLCSKCVDSRFIEIVERIESTRVPCPNRLLSEQERQLSSQLYYMLVMLVKGRALDVVQSRGKGEGFEALRKLEELYQPKLASRFVGSLSLILNTRFSSTDVEAELELSEKTIRRYESETGKALDDQILLGVVINGLQDNSVRDHIIRNTNRLTSYQLVRDELLEIARTRGKGSKGKDDKGKGKGKTKGTSSNTALSKEKTCFYCSKPGHIKAERRKKQADDRAKGSKGSKGEKGKNAATPEQEPQSEPLSSLMEDSDSVAAIASPLKRVLVDTGAGSHLFQSGFDPHAVESVNDSSKSLVTVTGEPLTSGIRKKSVIECSGKNVQC